MILVDTSVWVKHLRNGLPRLATLLQEGAVLIHPWVIGELACCHLRNRHQVLELLQGLPTATLASDACIPPCAAAECERLGGTSERMTAS